MKDLIRKLLNPDAKSRISIDEAIKHPWFNILEEQNQKSSLIKVENPQTKEEN